ncbi:MAG: methyltransferase domain-containing protein [Microthrixaceae bacterium]|nr:methyltransferase domain-containing protein [Microthrixaceae bacterium]
MTENRWLQMIEQNPGHSAWYIERWRSMAAAGDDLDGEARLVDAMAPRGARILDAGCGTGRVGGRLAALGHRVTGIDLDPVLIEAARAEHPNAEWIVGDLAEVDLGATERFDVIVCAGNVMTFLDPATRVDVLARIRSHLAPEGRAVIGFGSGRGYPFEEFFADAAAAGLSVSQNLATWDVQPFDAASEFLVAILSGS